MKVSELEKEVKQIRAEHEVILEILKNMSLTIGVIYETLGLTNDEN